MNLLHLKYAVEVSKTKSISKAAENLFMGQPNLSRAIRELEESLDIVIFERSTKGISVTEAGEEFLQYARRILSQVDEVEALYREGRNQKQRFSVCVPRASYISTAFSAFAEHINRNHPAEIFYKETNSMRSIRNVENGDYNLGIVRYQIAFEQYFAQHFADKGLVSETITNFTYHLLVSSASSLANKAEILPRDLTGLVEITHGDPYVPSLPTSNVKKAEFSDNVDKRIYVFERASQFELLRTLPDAFMWVSPIPPHILADYGLVQRTCENKRREYKDVLIYRQEYRLSELDRLFMKEVLAQRDAVFEAESASVAEVMPAGNTAISDLHFTK